MRIPRVKKEDLLHIMNSSSNRAVRECIKYSISGKNLCRYFREDVKEKEKQDERRKSVWFKTKKSLRPKSSFLKLQIWKLNLKKTKGFQRH